MLMRSVDTSRKFVDTIGKAGTVLITAAILLVNITDRGVNRNQRIGSIERAFSLQFRLTLIAPVAANPSTAAFVRVVLFRWKQPNGSEPTAADLFQEAGDGVEMMISPYNLDSRGKFKIYYDRVFQMQQQSPGAARLIRVYRKLRFQVFHTTGNDAADITSIERNALFILLVGDNDTGGNQPTFNLFTRYRFTG